MAGFNHPVYVLGKGAPKRDPRNLLFARLRRKGVTLPTEYDFDVAHPGNPPRMYLNDSLGCCVIASRANYTARAELIEQRKVIKITDAEVKRQYLRETGGEDEGLVMLTSISLWRKKGWTAAKQLLRIQAFSEIKPKDHTSVKEAIFTDFGVQAGLALPETASIQLDRGKPWDVATIKGYSAAANSWGGHAVYIVGYTKVGPVCWTWGAKQQITWRFWDRYCDEAYLTIDAVNTKKRRRLIDVRKLNEFLKDHPVAK